FGAHVAERAHQVAGHGQHGQPGVTDYSPVAGVDPFLADVGLIDRVGNYEGALPQNVMTRLSDITDGPANTLMVAEDAGRPQLWRAGRLVPGQFSRGGPWASIANPILILGASGDGARVPGPCPINCTNDQQPYSFHPGGANFLFADG